MKVSLLSALLLAVLSIGSYGVTVGIRLTPKNLAEQPFKFTIVPRKDNLGLFKITVEPTDPKQNLADIVPVLTLFDGEKRVATVRPVTVIKNNSMEVLSFYVSSDCLATSMLEFDVEGASWWFYLKDFIAP